MLSLNYFRNHYPTPVEGVTEAVIGLAFYSSLFHGIIQFLQNQKAKGRLQNLSSYDVAEISNKFVSSTFAIFTCSLALKVYNECGSDIIHEKHNMVRHYMCFAVFYFLYDTYAMYVVYREGILAKRAAVANGTSGNESKPEVPFLRTCQLFLAGRPLIVVHHLVLPLVLFPIFMTFQTGLGDCLLSVGFLMEASTPLVSARKVLSVLGLKNSLLYVLNGAVMTLMFFCCRIILLPYIFHLFASQLGVSYFETVIYRVPWFCTVSMFLVWLPQVYWWYLMINGCMKVVNNFQKKKAN